MSARGVETLSGIFRPGLVFRSVSHSTGFAEGRGSKPLANLVGRLVEILLGHVLFVFKERLLHKLGMLETARADAEQAHRERAGRHALAEERQRRVLNF